MNAPDGTGARAWNSVSARFILGLAVVLFFLFAMATVGLIPVWFAFVGDGLFGWLRFLVRVVPAIAWNPLAILTGVVCLGGLMAGAHRFLGWLAREWQAGGAGPTPWRWRWTVAAVLLVVLSFTAGLSAIGIIRQAAWIRAAPEPWIRSEHWLEPIGLVYEFSPAIEAARKARRKLDRAALNTMQERAGERFRVVVIDDRAGLPWLVMAGPRNLGDPRWNQCAMMAVNEASQGMRHDVARFTAEQWQALIARAEAGLPLDEMTP
jgi:hypothetical protein